MYMLQKFEDTNGAIRSREPKKKDELWSTKH